MDFKTRYQYNPKTDLLGRGGFSKVFKATDTLLDREVALKIFNLETSGKYDLISEIRKVIKLDHPNLCRYYDVAFIESVNTFGEEENHQVGVLEYLDGGDLKTCVEQHPEYLKKLLTDVLQGLAFLHENGIIHRDLKPANILIKNTAKGPIAKITDFGISKEIGPEHTSSSQLMGTIEYMAPEQFSPEKFGINGRISTNLDLWSFGLMVYELLTGESLFGSRGSKNSAEQVMNNILNDELIDDKTGRLPEPYRLVASKCVVKNASQRVQTADELISILQRKPMPDQPVPPVYETVKMSNQPASPVNETVKMPNQPASPVNETVKLSNQPASPVNEAAKMPNQPAPPVDEPVKLPKPAEKNDTIVAEKSPAKKQAQLNKPEPSKINSSRNKMLFIAGIIVLVLLVTAFFVLKSHFSTAPGFDTPAQKAYTKLYPVMDTTTTKWGYADSTGRLIIPYQYDWADSVFDGMARINNNKKFGFIDSKGTLLVGPKYSFVGRYCNGLAVVEDSDKHEGYINKTGKVAIPIKYDYAYDFKEGLALVSLNSKWGFIDKTGKLAIPMKYDYASFFEEGLAEVEVNYLWGFIDTTGKLVIPMKYNSANIFSDGLAPVELNSKYGFIDKTGKTVIPMKYDDADFFSEGLAYVKLNSKYGFIDKTDNMVIPVQYDDANIFSEGLAPVRLNSKVGFIDKTGKLVILMKYHGANFFSEGLATATLNSQVGFIDKTGKMVIPMKYDNARMFSEGLAQVALSSSWSYIDKTGKVLTDFK